MSSLTPRTDRLDRNYLINSAKDFAQRSAAAENLSASYAFNSLDRHAYKTAGSFNGTPTVQRVQDSPDGKTKYCSELVSDFADSAAELYEAQPIESVNSRDLVGEVISFSVWIKSESCTTLRLRLSTADVEDDFTAVTQFHLSSKTIVADGNWQEVKFENISTGAGIERGLLVETILTDSDSTGASESHRITRGKLNIGKTAQNWNYSGRDFSDEILLAYRYYAAGSLEEESYGLNATGIGNHVFLPVEMRALPVIGLTHTAGNNVNATPTPGYTTTKRFKINEIRTATNMAFWVVDWTADAEVTI